MPNYMYVIQIHNPHTTHIHDTTHKHTSTTHRHTTTVGGALERKNVLTVHDVGYLESIIGPCGV